MLDTFGEFPPKYRLTIWRALLRLPHARVAYGGLRSRGPHPSFASLAAAYPALPPRLLARLQRTCSALAWWAPVFAEAEGLPAMALPFVTLFGADDVGAFEALAAVLLNLTPGWFADFPSPPMRVIAVAEVRARRRRRASNLALTLRFVCLAQRIVAQQDVEFACHVDERLGCVAWREGWMQRSVLLVTDASCSPAQRRVARGVDAAQLLLQRRLHLTRLAQGA